jgi:hypothetical protein
MLVTFTTLFLKSYGYCCSNLDYNLKYLGVAELQFNTYVLAHLLKRCFSLVACILKQVPLHPSTLRSWKNTYTMGIILFGQGSVSLCLGVEPCSDDQGILPRILTTLLLNTLLQVIPLSNLSRSVLSVFLLKPFYQA